MLKPRYVAATVSVLAVTTGMVLSASSTQAAPPAVTSTAATPPSTIAADCSSDVSASLGAWLQAQPSSSNIAFPANACYRVEREIRVRAKAGWQLDGRGARLVRTTYTPLAWRYPKANAFLRLDDFVDSTVRNISVQGTNTVPDMPRSPSIMGAYRNEVEFDHGVTLDGARNVTLTGLSIHSVWGDGVKVTGANQWSRQRSAGVTISGSTITQNGRQGISINQTSGALVDGITVTYSRRSGIDLEPNGSNDLIEHIEIRNSTIGSRLLPFSSGGVGPANSVSIHDNVITNGGTPIVFVRSGDGAPRYDWRVQNNTVNKSIGSPRAGFEFYNVRGVRVEGNSVIFAARRHMTAVLLSSGSDQAVVSGNSFRGASTPARGTAPGATVSVTFNVM